MDWAEYYMGFAEHAAKKSKDSTQVGAILVDEDGAVILTAYNGPPRGVRDTPDRFERPEKYLFASHAEANLIAFAARQGIRTKGARLYCTHFPCAACTRTIIQAGIKMVTYGPGSFQALEAEKNAATDMMRDADITLRAYGKK